MNIVCKQGVWFSKVDDLFFEFAEALTEVWEKWGDTPTLTSAADGKHMEGSKHYIAEAWDLRVWGLHNPLAMSDALRARLNQDGEKWIVLYGDAHHKDHIHVQTNG